MIFVFLIVLLFGMLVAFSTKKNRHALAKFVYNTVNRIEAKLAGLSHANQLVDGLDVHYLSNTQQFHQNKPVLVLLHGFSADKYIWNRFAKRFSEHYQILIPDLKGHGQTPYDPSGDYSVPSQCQMMLQLLRQLRINKFSVVGNSMGGMMAAKYIDDIPQRVEKCVLIDPAGAKTPFSQNLQDNQHNPFAHTCVADFYAFYDLVMAKPPFVPQFILRMLAEVFIDKREQYMHMFHQFFNLRDFYPMDYRFDYDNAMLIWGINDKLLPVDDYTHWKAMLNASTRIYEDLGHMPMVEDVKKVSKDILCFLK
jgi:pimeloyl-ACP methyl ester carboxylesterase